VAIDPKQLIAMPTLDRADGAAQLELHTTKHGNGQLCSSAHVHFKRDGMITCELFGDFRKTLHRSRERATQKNLDAQHAAVFTPAAVEALQAEVIAFYADKDAKAARAAYLRA